VSQAARKRYLRLGIFIIGAVVIAIGFIVAFGAGYWLRPKVVMETYFNESVQGIDIGTPIKYRGVTVGQITRIGFTYTDYEQDKPPVQRKQYVLVEASLRPEELTGRMSIDHGVMEAWIEQGLRVQMAAQGITGTYYLELDYRDPRSNPPLPIDWKPDHLYIPSTPSTVGQIVSGAEALMRKLENANLDDVVRNLNALLVSVNRTLQTAQTEQVGAGVVALLAELRDSNRRLQTILGNPAWQSFPREASATLSSARKLVESDQISATIARLQKTLESLDRAAARLDRTLVGPEHDLPLILSNMRETTENLRDLTDTLRRTPSAALFSQPPAPLPRPGARR
jgi:ABC-type transporter Mla subunit MlaD